MINHRTAHIFLDADEHVWFKFKEDIEIGIQDSYDYVEIINQLCGGIKRYFILDSRNVFVNSTQHHREFMACNPEALRWRKADALLCNLLPNRMLARHYKNTFCTKHPINIFNTESEAKKWFRTLNVRPNFATPQHNSSLQIMAV